MNLKSVGKNLIRVDAYSKVTGKAIYPQDIYMENMAYGKTLRSSKAHAYVKIDTTEAEKVEGVLRVFTHKDVPLNEFGVIFKDHEVFTSKKVKKIGESLAFVVAESYNACDEGLKAIKVTYDEIPGVFDPIEAMKEGAPQVHDHTPNNMFHYKLRTGNVEEKRDSYVVAENTYSSHMVEHIFLQPEAGLSYIEEDGTLTVVLATQYPHYDREEVAKTLNLPEEKVRIINTAIGGAFGAREDISLQVHLALAALTLKRPIKTIYKREESFLAHSKRHPMVMKYKTGADKDGYLQFMEAEIIGDTGANASWATNVLRKAGVHATGPYHIPNVKVDSYAVYTNNPFAGAMRGFGATQVPIAIEQQMDILAEKLNMDPIEFRLKNVFRKGGKTATGQVLLESIPVDRCLEEMVSYSKEYKKIKEEKDQNPLKKRGLGVAASYYGTGYGNGFPDISRATVRLLEDSKIGVYVGATEVGQGAKTAMVQIVAETLNINEADIKLVSEDTKYMLDSGTAAATRQTYNTGNAVKIACENFLKELKIVAQKELELNAIVGLELEEGEIYLSFFPEKRISIKALSEKYANKVEAYGEFVAQTTTMDPETGHGAPYWPYTFNACLVLVEVDTSTGRVELLKSAFAQDVGRAINPKIVEGQVDGGFAMALGYALFEDLNLVKGEMKNKMFSKYLIPTSMDMVDIDTILVEDPESTAPYGAKGIGEPTTIPVAPAILNAIYDAIGLRILDLPATPENLIKAWKIKK
ncbi:MAG: xanthine dehydrogenase family protein molybdopterin-binding subunit [Tissierellia bacterium]|nr:xanthine dehydrogenase family protein molybdopterin-binding subunit [Tissierellia bacterium]